MSHIFISYSHKDSDYAHVLAETLEKVGFPVWIDGRIDFGSAWPRVIQEQLDSCGALIVVMTPRSYESDWVQNELNRAKRKGKPIFPLLLDGEPWLSVEATQYVDVRSGKLPPESLFNTLAAYVSLEEQHEIDVAEKEFERDIANLPKATPTLSRPPQVRNRSKASILASAAVLLVVVLVIVLAVVNQLGSTPGTITPTAPSTTYSSTRETEAIAPTATALPPTATIAPTATTLPPSNTPTATIAPTITASLIPGNTPTTPTVTEVNATSGNECTYTIQVGDTLFRIATRNNTTVNDIVAVNNDMNPNKIEPGQVIQLPGCVQGGTTIPQSSETPVSIGSNISSRNDCTYTILAGETLFAIAIRNDTTVNDIVATNHDMNPNKLEPGQVIQLPGCVPGTSGYPNGSPITANSQWTPVVQTFGGIDMVLVPKGCFDMGSTIGRGDEQPVSQVCFDAPFWIDRTEVTNAQYGSSGTFSGDTLPREDLNWFDAKDFCVTRSARLPTEAEWEYAARGPDDWIYPWGNDFVADNVVYSVNSNNQPAPVASKPQGASWVGALDMSGNVWEWVSSAYQSYPYNANDGREDKLDRIDVFRSVRGGSWYGSNYFLRAAFRRDTHPLDNDSFIGFRCARDYP